MAATVIESAEIVADASYPLDEFKRRTGLGSAAMREARDKGLRVKRVGRRHFVFGRDWLDYLERNAQTV